MKLRGMTWICNKCGTENDAQSIKCTNCGLHVEDNKIIATASTEGYVSTYKTARIISQVVSFVGWAVVVLSIFSLFSLSLHLFSMGLLVFAGGIISGILLVIAGQFTRATIDTADNTGKILVLLKSMNNKGI